VITLTGGCNNHGQNFWKLMRETNFDIEKSNLKRMNDVEIKEESQIKILNRFPVLENSDDNVDINKSLEQASKFRAEIGT
jgi:hypothetical protein